MPNRLAGSMSPYLLQHADNPVDWWPWCDEAFAEARRRDVPVLLSVGYAACHWCHVMAHESFEDHGTAALMDARFVSIKVDREERPDIDAVYMEATQRLTGSGGWPMTVFLDHAGRAFFAGTYFPPVARGRMPSFTDVLLAIDTAWRTDREHVREACEALDAALRDGGLAGDLAVKFPGVTDTPETVDLRDAVASLERDFDAVHGGFGAAPKFPPSLVLEMLLRADSLDARDTRSSGGEPESAALRMAGATMRAMARGGIYDQLAGGFARYSVDAAWVVPHFEKMLYDNALLLRAYLHWWRATGDPLARRIVAETADFLLAELRTAEGGFASSLDADSQGREGAFHVWTPPELDEVLGPIDGPWVAALCRVTRSGTFEHGASVLQLPADPPDATRWARCRAALAAARDRRPRPARDDKVVAAWNGLAIAALAEAGALLDEPRWLTAATGAAELLAVLHWDPAARRLARVSLGGQVGADATGVLEDYADLAEGLLALYQVSGQPRWSTLAGDLLDVVLERFPDGRGGFFDTATDAPRLVRRPQDPLDAVTPSGWSAAAHALITHAALGGGSRNRQAGEQALVGLLPLARRSPRYTGWAWSVAAAVVAGPVQVAVVLPMAHGLPTGQGLEPLHRTALASSSPGLVVAVGREGATDVGLLRDRPAIDGRPTAYPCRGFVCDLPITDPALLAQALRG